MKSSQRHPGFGDAWGPPVAEETKNARETWNLGSVRVDMDRDSFKKDKAMGSNCRCPGVT